MPHPKVTAAQDGRAIDSYKAHNAGVRRRIPKRQLLELDLSEGRGWEPLCLFLGVAAGDALYPALATSVRSGDRSWA